MAVYLTAPACQALDAARVTLDWAQRRSSDVQTWIAWRWAPGECSGFAGRPAIGKVTNDLRGCATALPPRFGPLVRRKGGRGLVRFLPKWIQEATGRKGKIYACLLYV